MAAKALVYLNRIVAGGPGEGGKCRWTDIVAAVRAAADDPSEDAEAMLRKVLDFEGDLALEEDSSLPHSMAPEDMLRSIAVQALAERNKEKHRDAITRVAGSTDSERLKAIARKLLA